MANEEGGMMEHQSHGSTFDPVKVMEHFDRVIENLDPAEVQKCRDNMATEMAKGGPAGAIIKKVLGIGLSLLV